MPNGNKGSEPYRLDNPIDRRRFLQAATVGGAATLAGCFGGNPENGDGTPNDNGNNNGDTNGDNDGNNNNSGGGSISTVVGGELGGNLYPSDNLIIETVTANTLMYNSLVTRDPETVQLVPDVAAEMPTVEGGQTFTFDLKEGVTFTDGTELIADDVKYSFEVLNEYDLTHKALLWDPIDTIEIEDDYRIRFEHSQPNAPWTGFLAIYFGLIQEGTAEEVDSFPDDLNNGPPEGAASGPFTLEEYRPQSNATFTARDDYHEDGIPAADEVNIEVIPEPSSQRVALSEGNVDILGSVTPKDYEPLLNQEGITGDSKVNPMNRITIYMSHQPPFDNVHNRKAVSYAIDRQGIIESIHYGRGHTSSVPAPPDSWFYNEEADVYGDRPQPDMVQEQLEMAGNPDGFSFTMKVSSQSPMTDTATIIQQNLREVGIDVELEQVAPGSFYGFIAEQDYVAGLEYWNSILYPGYYMFQLFAEFGSYYGWSQWGKYEETEEAAQEFTEIMRQARESPARDHRAPLLREAQQIFSDNAIFALVGGVNTDQLWRERVQNYAVMPSTWNNLRGVSTE